MKQRLIDAIPTLVLAALLLLLSSRGAYPVTADIAPASHSQVTGILER